MNPILAAMAGIRKAVRRLGFDVVRYNLEPRDVDPSVAETIRVVRPYTMTSVERLTALAEAVRYIAANEVPGDVVECGVWRGGSMMAIARHLLLASDASRHLYLFDTFEGMSQPTARDVAFTGETAADLLARTDRSVADSVWCVAPLQEVERNMVSTGYEPALIHYVKGKVEGTDRPSDHDRRCRPS